jgi:tripartite-type tricarboxylate transporter receptor subunit TctC
MNTKARLRLKAIQLFLCITLIFGVAPLALASSLVYPAKLVEVVVPFAAGGGADLTARILVEPVSKKWKQSINVLNKPGGNCVIGTNYVVRAAADGYTILFEGGGSSSMQALMTDLPYKIEERTFLVGTNALPGVFVVPGNSPWRTLSDVVAAAKKDPGALAWASLGGASQADLQLRQFFAAAGIEVGKTRIVAFPGAAPALNAAAGGHVQLAAASANAPLPLMAGGLVRGIGITSARRLKEMPDVPTTIEQGFPSVNTVYWGGFSGPPGLPEEVVKAWDQTLKEVLSDPELVSKLEKLTIMPMYLGPNDFGKLVIEETQMVKRLLGGR